MRHARMDDIKNGMAGPVANYASGRVLFGEGDKADHVFKLVSGVVRTCNFMSDGSRPIDAFYTTGDMFGFESGPNHSLSAEAVSDCAAVPYLRRRLDSLASEDGSFSVALFSYAMKRLAKAQGHSLLLARRSAVGRIAAFLVERSDCSRDRSTIDLAMTRQDIADYLGLTIETVSRTFSQFEREALIELPTARRVRLTDLPRLRRLDRADACWTRRPGPVERAGPMRS